MNFNADTEHLQIFAGTDDLPMPASPMDNDGVTKDTSLVYNEPSWDSPEPVESSNMVTMEPLTPISPSQRTIQTPPPPSPDPVNEQHSNLQDTLHGEHGVATDAIKMTSGDNDVNYVAALAASLLAEVTPPVNHDINQTEQAEIPIFYPVPEEKTPSTSPHIGNSRMSDEWSMILENAQPPDLRMVSQYAQSPTTSDGITMIPTALDTSVIFPAAEQASKSYTEHKSHYPEVKKIKLKRGTPTRPRKLSKREAAKAATAAALAEEHRLAHLAKTKQITDDELLRLKPKKKRRAAKFDKPVPSRFCHVCSRTPKSVRLAVCSKIKFGTCRKVICEKCFESYGYGDFESAKNTNETDWLCPHCDDSCPPRAQCRTYQRINDRLRISRLKQERPRGRSSRSSRYSHVGGEFYDVTDDDGMCATGSDHGSNSGTNTGIQADGMVVLEEEYAQDAIQAPFNPMVTINIPAEQQRDLHEDPMQLAVELENVECTQGFHDMPPLGEFIPSLPVPDGAHDLNTPSGNAASQYSNECPEQLTQELTGSGSDHNAQDNNVLFENAGVVVEPIPNVSHTDDSHGDQLWNSFSLGPLNDISGGRGGLTQVEDDNYKPVCGKGVLKSLLNIDDFDDVGGGDIAHAVDDVHAGSSSGNLNSEANLENSYSIIAEHGMECDAIAQDEVNENFENGCLFEEADCL